MHLIIARNHNSNHNDEQRTVSNCLLLICLMVSSQGYFPNHWLVLLHLELFVKPLWMKECRQPSVGCMRSTTIFFGKRLISLPRWFFSLWSNDVEIFIEEDLCVYKITETTQSLIGSEIGLRAGKPLHCLRNWYRLFTFVFAWRRKLIKPQRKYWLQGYKTTNLQGNHWNFLLKKNVQTQHKILHSVNEFTCRIV